MKYRVVLSGSQKPELFTGKDAAGQAREFFATARACLSDGEGVELTSESQTGIVTTLARVHQPKIMSFSEAFPN